MVLRIRRAARSDLAPDHMIRAHIPLGVERLALVVTRRRDAPLGPAARDPVLVTGRKHAGCHGLGDVRVVLQIPGLVEHGRHRVGAGRGRWHRAAPLGLAVSEVMVPSRRIRASRDRRRDVGVGLEVVLLVVSLPQREVCHVDPEPASPRSSIGPLRGPYLDDGAPR